MAYSEDIHCFSLYLSSDSPYRRLNVATYASTCCLSGGPSAKAGSEKSRAAPRPRRPTTRRGNCYIATIFRLMSYLFTPRRECRVNITTCRSRCYRQGTSTASIHTAEPIMAVRYTAQTSVVTARHLVPAFAAKNNDGRHEKITH